MRIALILTVALTLPVHADRPGLTAADVVALAEAGLSSKTIQTQIDVMGARLTFTAAQLVRLKKAGASEAWIRRLVRTGAPRPAPPTRLERNEAQVRAAIGPVYRRHPAVGNSMIYGLADSGRPWFWPYYGYYGNAGYSYGPYGHYGPYAYSVPLRPGNPIQFYTQASSYQLKHAHRLGLGIVRPVWEPYPRR